MKNEFPGRYVNVLSHSVGGLYNLKRLRKANRKSSVNHVIGYPIGAKEHINRQPLFSPGWLGSERMRPEARYAGGLGN